MKAALLTLLCASTAFAQQAVTGRVLDRNGKPLKNARVTNIYSTGPSDAASRAMETSVDGSFRFEGAFRGSVFVKCDGYLDALQEHGPGQTAPLEFRLLPEAVVAGRVTNERGEPMSGCQVHIMRWNYRGTPRTLEAERETTRTGADGAYSIGSLASGTYFVVVEPEGSPLDGRLPKQYIATYFPSATRLQDAEAVVLTAGQRLNADVILHREPMFRVTAHVQSPVEGPVTLRVYPPSLPGQRSSSMGIRDRPMQLGLLPRGEYEIDASSSRGPTNAYAQQTLIVEHDQEITLILQPGFTASGRITVVGPQTKPPAPLGLSLQGRLPSPRAAADVDGEFLLKDLGPFPYGLRIDGLPSGGYVRSVRIGEEDFTGRRVTFVPGARIEISVSLASAQIEGIVRDAEGNPVPGALIALWKPGGVPPDSEPLVSWELAGAGGKFRLKTAFPAGEYVMLATAADPGGRYLGPLQVPLLRAQFEALATPVTIGDDGTLTRDPAYVSVEAIRAAEAKLGGR